MAAHGVVVGGQDAGAEEHVVLDDAEAGDVDVGLDLDARADDDVVVDGRAAPDDAVGADAAALAHEGLIADDRARADVRAGEDDRPGAHRGAVLDDERVELGARRAGGRRQPWRLAEHGVVLDDDAVADDDAVVDDDVGAEADVAADGGGGAENETGGGVIGHGGYPSGAVPSPDSTRPLRCSRARAGLIGRHHAAEVSTLKAVVVALGKIGLPLATQIARAGHEVIGCDIDAATVDARQRRASRRSPARMGSAEALAEVVGDGRLRATTDTHGGRRGRRRSSSSRCRRWWSTPTPGPTGARWTRCSPTSAPGCRPGTTVAVETTLPVGTTRNRVAPALARHSGLRAEDEFFCVFSPERVYSGRVLRDLATYPKLLGGLSAAGEARGVKLYRSFLEAEVWPMGSAEAAELTKLAETTYRDVNIALANEFARFADRTGIDIDRVIAAANSQPFSHIHRPGVAVGGHCIPVYPRFYLDADPEARLPGAAREVNEAMPGLRRRRCSRPSSGTLAGARVVILGVAYRGNVKETAFSGAFALRDALAARGAEPLVDRPALRRRRAARARASSPGTGATRPAPSCRPTTPATRPSGPTTCPACAPSSTAAACSTARASPPPAWRCGASAAAERSARGERGDDARARVPVAVELGALGGRRALQRGQRRAGVEVDQHVPADVDGLDPLGRVAHRHARHARQVGLLLHAARVGEHRAGARRAAR